MNLRLFLRSTFLFVFFFLVNQPFFSLGGVLADSKGSLHVIQTEYFDIIFPEECQDTAKKIADVCDSYYLEITEKLETQAWQRFPVTITHSTESLNAYFAAIPYNRIVLYDTMPETNLDMYEDTIKSVFYHELTHAVTYNMKGPVLKKLSFFADILTPSWLNISTFWAEGATVSFESKGRGGRLNDPFSTQMVNQALIEDDFPSWRDVTGARDTYPGGTDAYMFGSMFASYLQETYGMSKYAEFWKRANSRLTLSFIAGVFKKTYGKSISQVWEEFEKTLNLEHKEKSGNLLSKKKSRITSLDIFYDVSAKEKKIACYDKSSLSLSLLTMDFQGKVLKNKKLLAIGGVEKVNFSPDGEKLAITRLVDRKNIKSVTAEYDLTSGKYKEYPEFGRKDGFYFQKNDEVFFANFFMKGEEACDNKVFSQNSIFSKGEEVFSITGVAENLGAALVKKGLKWKIRFFNDRAGLFEYDFSKVLSEGREKNLIIHNLHSLSSDSENVCLSFTWAELGQGGRMLSRAGFMKVDLTTRSAKVFLQKENSFAGFVDFIPDLPSLNGFEEGGEGKSFPVYFVAAEYEKSPLYCLEMSSDDFEEIEVVGEKTEVNENYLSSEIVKGEEEERTGSYKEISYNSFRYYKKGIIVPFLGFVPVYNHDLDTDSSSILGLTLASTNPWGDKRIEFAAGYDIRYKNGGMKLSLTGGDNSLSYTLSGTCVFDGQGFMQTMDSLSFSKTLWSGRVSSFSGGCQGNFLYGRQLINKDFKKNFDESIGKSADGIFYLLFSNIHKISPKYGDFLGLSFQPFILASWRSSEEFIEDDKYLNAGGKFTVKFPVLFPFTVTASLFPSSKYAASASISAVLADFEIHKGIPALSLFIQRLVINASYSGKLAYVHGDFWDVKNCGDIFSHASGDDYSDALKLGVNLQLSPNTGFFASDEMIFVFAYNIIYRPHPENDEGHISYGFSFAMNY
ncbi:MAG: hypothetical protein K5873_00650 [Treponema sp.]|nr:hypothetical protein [Treponema sp.]